ncbi:MAG: dehydrogenase E1 component subunit alpha/beta, partial [Bacteroidota bacterium]
MASDDRTDDRARFTTRTLLTPDDEPGDGLSDAIPEPTLSTPGDDDEALDAVVQTARDANGSEEAPAFVWGVPNGDETVDVSPVVEADESISEAPAGEPEGIDLDAYQPGETETPVFGEESEDEQPDAEAGTTEATPEIEAPVVVGARSETADAPADAGAADGDEPKSTTESGETDTAEDSSPITAAIDDAFEAQTDEAKSNEPGAEIEATIDVPMLGPDDFGADELTSALRTMMTSRQLDQKMLTLLKQGKGFFHIGSSGHEASQVAIGRQLEGGRDWFSFYYRDLGTALAVGMTPADVLRAHFAKATDPSSGGRQMSEHFSSRELNILVASSSVGAQYLPAVGVGLAIQRETEDDSESAIVYASGGEGSTSQGAFHEALNWSAREALPVLFHVQDNGYAISVPVEEQTAGGSIWHLFAGYQGLARIRYDGTDFFASASAAKAAIDHMRAGRGPVALHADVVRLLPHSSSDDHKKYREHEALEADRQRDPIPQMAERLVEAGILTEAEVEAMEAEVRAEIDALAREVAAEPDPDPATATRHVYYEGPDSRQYETDGEAGDLIVMVDAINHALDEEMARDERVLVYGEDVGGGKGGVFTATRGLTAKHGADRCFNSPLAEHSIIGSAVGLAASGYKPVVEIQFADYIWPALQPLRNQVASFRYRSNNEWSCPMVIRVPCGGYIHGGLCHSQNIEAIFGHFPGLHVVMPSNAADAKGLLKAAIRGEDPVLFLEHKSLYRQGPARSPEPHDDYLVPLGKARTARAGDDLTIVTWGALVYRALNAAKTLEKEGVSVEVIDVRSILPFDTEAVLASAKKTGRVLVAYEDHEFMGFGAEVAAQ